MESEHPSQEWLPGLPPDLALLCLARISRDYHPSMKCVCKSWNTLLQCSYFFRKRQDLGVKDVSILVCSRSFSCHWEIYFSELKKWHLIPPTPTQIPLLTNFSTATIGSKLYVIGGRSDLVNEFTGEFEDYSSTNEMWIYDLITNKWTRGSSMSVSRSNFASSVIDEKIFVAGGTVDLPNFAECYDPKTQAWESIPYTPQVESSLTFKESMFGFAYDTMFFACVHDKTTLVYDPEKKNWNEFPNIKYSRKPVTINGEMIYSFICPQIFLDTITHNHHLRSKCLVQIPNFDFRYGYGLLEYKGCLLIIGGLTPKLVPLNDVLVYDVQNVSWSSLPSMNCSKGTIVGCGILNY